MVEETTRFSLSLGQGTGTGELVAEIDRLNKLGPCEFHLVVPSTHSKSYARARRLSMLGADPFAVFSEYSRHSDDRSYQAARIVIDGATSPS